MKQHAEKLQEALQIPPTPDTIAEMAGITPANYDEQDQRYDRTPVAKRDPEAFEHACTLLIGIADSIPDDTLREVFLGWRHFEHPKDEVKFQKEAVDTWNGSLDTRMSMQRVTRAQEDTKKAKKTEQGERTKSIVELEEICKKLYGEHPSLIARSKFYAAAAFLGGKGTQTGVFADLATFNIGDHPNTENRRPDLELPYTEARPFTLSDLETLAASWKYRDHHGLGETTGLEEMLEAGVKLSIFGERLRFDTHLTSVRDNRAQLERSYVVDLSSAESAQAVFNKRDPTNRNYAKGPGDLPVEIDAEYRRRYLAASEVKELLQLARTSAPHSLTGIDG